MLTIERLLVQPPKWVNTIRFVDGFWEAEQADEDEVWKGQRIQAPKKVGDRISPRSTVTKVECRRVQSIDERTLHEAGYGEFTPAYVAAGEINGPDGKMPSEDYAEQHPVEWGWNAWVWLIWSEE